MDDLVLEVGRWRAILGADRRGCEIASPWGKLLLGRRATEELRELCDKLIAEYDKGPMTVEREITEFFGGGAE